MHIRSAHERGRMQFLDPSREGCERFDDCLAYQARHLVYGLGHSRITAPAPHQ